MLLYIVALLARNVTKLQPKSYAAQLIRLPIHSLVMIPLAAMLCPCEAAQMQYYITQSIWIWPLLAFVGACFGSFISLISYRMARDLPWIAVRSRCPSCEVALGGRDLIPVLSYLLSGRKCRHCKEPMSARYIMVELATAASFVALYWLKGATPEFIILAALAVCIITMIVTDLEHYMIPDTIQLAIFLLGLAYAFTMGLPLDDRLIGALVFLGLGLSLHFGYFWLMGKHGLGFGDVKLLASIGLWIPLLSLPVFLFLAGMLGVLTALLWRLLGLGQHFPFGPALICSMLALVLWPELGQLFYYMAGR